MIVISLMWGSAWERYGQTFVETFMEHWPLEVGLRVVTDRFLPLPGSVVQPRLDDLPHLDQSRRYDVPAVSGKDAWKFDARKWAPQGIAPLIAIQGLEDGEIVCWLDADVETLTEVPAGFVEGLLGDADVIHLGRPGKWSEIGFWACRLSPGVRAWIEDMADAYATGAVLKMEQWHSAFVFDRCLERTGLTVRNLTPNGRGHVWFQSPLGQYMDHKKGKRKDVGYSKERFRHGMDREEGATA